MQNLLHSLKQFSIITITTFAISLTVAHPSPAQSYTITPNDSILATGTMDIETSYDIVQTNNYPDTIFLYWEKVSAVLPDQWVALICDNNLCYNGLLQGGNMDSMFQGHDGLLSVHVTPHANAGKAIIRYAVWDISNASLKDTLTWVINANPTGISPLTQNSTIIFISGNNLVVQNNDRQLTHIRVSNLEGRILLESSLTDNKMLFYVSNFSTGTYFVQATGTNRTFTRKVLIQ